jgi:hypothetical protein
VHYGNSDSGMEGCDKMAEKKTTDTEKTQVPKEEQLPEEKRILTTVENPISKSPALDADSIRSPERDFPLSAWKAGRSMTQFRTKRSLLH